MRIKAQFAFLVACLLVHLSALGQHTAELLLVDRVSNASHLPDGVDVQDGQARMQVVALRPDVIRIRVARTQDLGEDASWAVLAEARHSRAQVSRIDTGDAVGFRTGALEVLIYKGTFGMTISDREGNLLQRDAMPIEFHGNSFRISKVMPADEHYFGLGDKPGPLDRRDQSFTMWNTDAYPFQESTDPLYKSIPYYMGFRSGRAYGLLLDNTWRTNFDFGKDVPNILSFGSVDGPLDYYFFYGPTPKQVVETYGWLTGKAPLPPMWALGFQQSRYTYIPQTKVLEIADRLRADRIPADAIYLDIEFQQKNRPFSIDRERFPDFRGMVAQLAEKGFHTVAITDLHIAKVPDGSYPPYATGMQNDEFVKNRDGSVYYGSVWPGLSAFPDFTRSETRKWWGSLYKDFIADGIAGFWNDMNEPSIFDSPTHTMPEDVVHGIDDAGFAKRTATHAEIHNVYGMENSRATFDAMRQLMPNERPFVLTRATFAGGQRYAATWTGDNSSTWNHLRLTTPIIENLGLSGFALTGADVGGFAGTPPPDLLTKWIEIGAFQPIDRDHAEKSTGAHEPWADGDGAEVIRRKFIEERYRLMPYLYTVAEEASRTGLPIERPLFLEYPNAAKDGHPIDIDLPSKGEFLFGPSILVAPPPYPEKRDDYAVEFPTAIWYDYWTGQRVPKPQASDPDPNAPPSPTELVPLTTWVHPELEKLPVFVKGGTILPVAPVVQSTNETPKGPLTLRVYVGDDCSGDLYLDDGKSYDYEKGKSLRMHSTCEATPDNLHIDVGAHQGDFSAWWKEIRLEIFGWNGSKVAEVRGASVPVESMKSGGQVVVLPDEGRGIHVDLRTKTPS